MPICVLTVNVCICMCALILSGTRCPTMDQTPRVQSSPVPFNRVHNVRVYTSSQPNAETNQPVRDSDDPDREDRNRGSLRTASTVHHCKVPHTYPRYGYALGRKSDHDQVMMLAVEKREKIFSFATFESDPDVQS